ncbi:MAG: hypothetical protein ACXWPS_07605 [Ktedonobacteraceae bacterium]
MHQIDGSGPKAHSILDPRIHLHWERSGGDLAAVRTLFTLHVMLVQKQAGRWRIHHLSPFDLHRGYRLQLGLAVLTACNRMHDHLIGALTPHQRLAWMVLLSTWLLPALLA